MRIFTLKQSSGTNNSEISACCTSSKLWNLTVGSWATLYCELYQKILLRWYGDFAFHRKWPLKVPIIFMSAPCPNYSSLLCINLTQNIDFHILPFGFIGFCRTGIKAASWKSHIFVSILVHTAGVRTNVQLKFYQQLMATVWKLISRWPILKLDYYYHNNHYYYYCYYYYYELGAV